MEENLLLNILSIFLATCAFMLVNLSKKATKKRKDYFSFILIIMLSLVIVDYYSNFIMSLGEDATEIDMLLREVAMSASLGLRTFVLTLLIFLLKISQRPKIRISIIITSILFISFIIFNPLHHLMFKIVDNKVIIAPFRYVSIAASIIGIIAFIVLYFIEYKNQSIRKRLAVVYLGVGCLIAYLIELTISEHVFALLNSFMLTSALILFVFLINFEYETREIELEEINEEYANQITKIKKSKRECRISARTFGYFVFLVDGKPVHFKRKKSNELLAYLIDKEGDYATKQELATTLFDDIEYSPQLQDYLSKIIADVDKTLKELNITDFFNKERGIYSINKELISCDSYDYLDGKNNIEFNGEYMVQYPWASYSISKFEK